MATDLIARYSELTAEGTLQVRHGEFLRAAETFEEARRLAERLDDQPLLFKALCNLSTAKLSLGQIEEAERQYVAAANLDPDRVEGWSALLAFYLREHDSRGASEVCSRLLSVNGISDSFRQQCAPFGLEVQ